MRVSEPIPYGAQPGWWGQDQEEPSTRCSDCQVDLEAADHEPYCDLVVWGEPEQ